MLDIFYTIYEVVKLMIILFAAYLAFDRVILFYLKMKNLKASGYHIAKGCYPFLGHLIKIGIIMQKSGGRIQNLYLDEFRKNGKWEEVTVLFMGNRSTVVLT
jgi:hypothetical protein